MRNLEWLITITLVAAGLSCLTMAATSMVRPDSIRSYLGLLLNICLWAGIPVIVALVIYVLINRKKGD